MIRDLFELILPLLNSSSSQNDDRMKNTWLSDSAWKLLLLPLLVGVTTALQQPELPARSRCLSVAVVVPGFLTGSADFDELCANLGQECGITAVAVPMPAWHWIPCLGGRSVKPILQRIDFTVQWLVAHQGDVSKIPRYTYTIKDLWDDFWTNPGGIFSVGGSDQVDEYPCVQPHGQFPLPTNVTENTVKIGLLGHSAGGWISRIYLSDRPYGGKGYGGTRFIHSLVTLGTPHRNGPGPAFAGIRWVEQEEALVPSLAVGATGFDSNDWGSFTQGAYQFCGFENDTSGDGVTPLESAFDYRGAQQLALDRVHHISWRDTFGAGFVSKELTRDHQNGTPWYGSPPIVKMWGPFLKANANDEK